MNNTTLFSPLTIGQLELPNRMIMAPMTRSRANDAGVQPEFTQTYYAQRANAGLIISEAINISTMAKGYPGTPGLFTQEQIESWKNITSAVHSAGGRIFAQLFHTGRIALPDFLPGKTIPVAPSAIAAVGQNYTPEGMKPFVTPRALETSEIAGVVEEFRQATINAFEAGFDGVELHSASGYIVQQFLDSSVNQRKDEYGGSIENRSRFALEVLDAMISVNGADKVGIKLSPRIPFNDIKEPDAEEVYPYLLHQLSTKGLAFVHVADSEKGKWHSLLHRHYSGVYFAGSGFNKQRGEALLATGGADAIVFGVLYLANPDLAERFKNDAPLNEPLQAKFYAQGPEGYIDYPSLAVV